MSIKIRPANQNDVQFVATLYTQGVNDGHFMPQHNLPINNMVNSWVTSNGILRIVEGIDGVLKQEFVEITFLIAEWNGKQAGFLISAPETTEKNQSREMYLMGVSKTFRKNGVATNLIAYEEERHKSDSTFYVRCYKKSTWAIALFKKLGYKVMSITPQSGQHYMRK